MIYSFDLSNKVIVITGGYGYLGVAISNSLLFHNAIVVILGKTEEKFELSFKENNRDNLSFFYCDVSSSNSLDEAFLRVIKIWGRIDVLINNAFYSIGQSPEKMSDEDWEYGIDGTLGSVFRAIRSAIPLMKHKSSGKIINVASMYGIVAPDFQVYDSSPQFLNPPHYGAAKAAVIQLTRYYASYLGPQNINVNSVSPGPFPSFQVQSDDEDFIKALSSRTCLGRIGQPEDLGGVFVFLSSDASNYITGQNIVVDGGWTTT